MLKNSLSMCLSLLGVGFGSFLLYQHTSPESNYSNALLYTAFIIIALAVACILQTIMILVYQDSYVNKKKEQKTP